MRIERALALLAAACLAADLQAQQPVRIGGTLSLTGPLAATSAIHKVAGEIYVDELTGAAACSAARWSGC